MRVADKLQSASKTYSSQRTDGRPEIRIVHFNDVYHIEAGSAEPVGGIARFQTAVEHYRNACPYTSQPNLVTLFSGDAYNPSLESSVTKGSHMVPVLNRIGVDVACLGNHDLDFGVSQFRHLGQQCSFPWLVANVLDPALGDDMPIGGCQKTAIFEASNGIKLGIIGLAEREWLDTINSLPPNLIYKSASATAIELVPDLRARGADIIIALTHAREPSDHKLAEKTPAGLIDIILGGHDHFYAHCIVNGTHVLRSGTDFKQLSYIEGRRKSKEEQGWDFDITRQDITRAVPEDEDTLKLVDKLTSSLKSKLEKPIGYTAVPLDGRFTTVRTRESNIGNFVCDLMRHFYSADCAIMAAGTIRGDQIYPPGVLQLKDILNCFPFEDPVVVLRVSGKALLEALENSVSLVPALEGRFPQVSNIQFKYDPSRRPHSRILWVKVHGQPLDLKRQYQLATRGYMGRAKDGFSSLLVKSEGGEAEEVVSEENGILISMMLRQYFMSLKVLGKWARWSPSLHRHWGGVHEHLHTEGKIKKPRRASSRTQQQRAGFVDVGSRQKIAVNGTAVDSDSDDDMNGREEHLRSQSTTARDIAKERWMYVARVYTRRWMERTGFEKQRAGMDEEQQNGDWVLPSWTHGISPKLEDRIIVVTDELRKTTTGVV